MMTQQFFSVIASLSIISSQASFMEKIAEYFWMWFSFCFNLKLLLLYFDNHCWCCCLLSQELAPDWLNISKACMLVSYSLINSQSFYFIFVLAWIIISILQDIIWGIFGLQLSQLDSCASTWSDELSGYSTVYVHSTNFDKLSQFYDSMFIVVGGTCKFL
jgi:hypothetical protein